MSRFCTLLALVLGLAFISAQELPQETPKPKPKPCCFPRQYEVKSGVTLSEEWGPTMAAMMPRVSVDFDRNMTSLVELTDDRKTAMSILDYNTMMLYVIVDGDCDKRVCRKMKLPSVYAAMATPCVQKDATFVGAIKMGYGKRSLECDTWLVERRIRDPPTRIREMLVVQSDGCVPVNEYITVRTGKQKMTDTTNYFDFTPGIKDPSVFNVPSICNDAKDLDQSVLSDTVNSVIRKFSR